MNVEPVLMCCYAMHQVQRKRPLIFLSNHVPAVVGGEKWLWTTSSCKFWLRLNVSYGNGPINFVKSGSIVTKCQCFLRILLTVFAALSYVPMTLIGSGEQSFLCLGTKRLDRSRWRVLLYADFYYTGREPLFPETSTEFLSLADKLFSMRAIPSEA